MLIIDFKFLNNNRMNEHYNMHKIWHIDILIIY